MEPNNFYAVFIGSTIGVFSTRLEAEEQTESYPDGHYGIYPNHQDAIEALENFFIGVPIETNVGDSGQYSTNETKCI